MKELKRIIVFFGTIYIVSYTMMRTLFLFFAGSKVNSIFIMVGCLFILMALTNKIIKKTIVYRKTFFIGMICYFGYIILNLIYFDRASSYALYEYVFYLLEILVMMYIICKFGIYKIVRIYEWIGVFVSVEAIYEYISGNIFFREGEFSQTTIRRAYGLVGTPLTLGLLLSCISICSLYFAITYNKKHFIYFVISFLGLLSTQSRGPLISFFVGIFICILLRTYERNVSIHNLFKIILKMVVFFLIGLYLVFLLVSFAKDYNDIFNNVYTRILSIFSWSGDDSANTQRINFWMNSYEILLKYPIFGYGVSTTGPHASTGIITESGVLKKLVETGIVGFVIYYGIMIDAVFKFRRTCLKSGDLAYPLMIAIIFAIFIENIVLETIESITTVTLLNLALAYILLLTYKLNKEKPGIE